MKKNPRDAMAVREFICKTVVRLVIMIVVLVVVFMITQTPVFTNDIAMGQMENSNDWFVAMTMYQKFASEQKVTIQENENKAALAKAEAEAEALIIKAEGEAEANRVLAESLSDEILKKEYYDKWDGVLPIVYGADGNLLQIPVG